MREIKFRAWMLNHKNSYYPKHTMQDWEVMQDDRNFFLNEENFNVDFIILQYTGLKDKNGNEICEGDICKYESYKDFVEIVKYHHSGFSPFADSCFGDEIFDEDKCEIIGNIYENPELCVKE